MLRQTRQARLIAGVARSDHARVRNVLSELKQGLLEGSQLCLSLLLLAMAELPPRLGFKAIKHGRPSLPNCVRVEPCRMR